MNSELHELVSAYVDGEATAEEVIAVESNPEAMALAAQFRELATMNAAVHIDPTEQSRIIDQVVALHLGDITDRPADSPRDLATAPRLSVVHNDADSDRSRDQNGVIELAARRQRRPKTWIMSAAAGLFMVVGGTMLVSQMRSQTNDAGTEGAALTTTMAAAEADAAAMPMESERGDDPRGYATDDTGSFVAENDGAEDSEGADSTELDRQNHAEADTGQSAPATHVTNPDTYDVILDASLGPDAGEAALDAAVELGFPVLHQAILNQSDQFMTCTLPTAPLSWVAVDIDGVEHWLVIVEPSGSDQSTASPVGAEVEWSLLAPDCTSVDHPRMAD